MNTETMLARSREAALAAGASQVDCFHRSSRTRILALEAGRPEWSERREEGMAVRAWSGQGIAAMAAATCGGDPQELGRTAAEMSGARPPRTPGADEDTEAAAAQPTEAIPAPPPVDLFDPEFLRASRRDLEHRLAGLAAATGIARRAGLPAATRAVLRLATLDHHLLTRGGVWQAQRSTLASLQLRFPSAFGLSAVEIASRRLAALDTAPLVPWLAAHPGPTPRMARWRAVPDEQGEAVITLAPPVMAALLTSVAARAAAGGHPIPWQAAGLLMDEPFATWGPGATPLDGEGQPTRRTTLAGPPGELPVGDRGPAAIALSPLRLSYREPPRPLPTNLVLERMPTGGAAAAGAGFHLLDVVARHGGWLLVRASRRHQGDHDQPVLMEIPARLESFFGRAATAGPAQPFLVGDAFVSTPAITLPGWRVVQAG